MDCWLVRSASEVMLKGLERRHMRDISATVWSLDGHSLSKPMDQEIIRTRVGSFEDFKMSEVYLDI